MYWCRVKRISKRREQRKMSTNSAYEHRRYIDIHSENSTNCMMIVLIILDKGKTPNHACLIVLWFLDIFRFPLTVSFLVNTSEYNVFYCSSSILVQVWLSDLTFCIKTAGTFLITCFSWKDLIFHIDDIFFNDGEGQDNDFCF